MLNGLRSVRVRRLLYLGSAALVVIAVTTRVFLGGDDGIEGVARELTSNIAGAVIVWALSIAFVSYFFAREQQAHETQVIDGDASARRFQKSADEATTWYHHGQIGRWVRENALPTLVSRATRTPAPLTMIVILLDPRLDGVCKSHADRRNARRRKESDPFTAEHIKCQIASTVLALAKAEATISSFKASVFVSDLDLPFRIDLCDDYGFITHEDQTAPAFGFEKESPYFATTNGYFSNFSSSSFRAIDLAAVASGVQTMSAKNVNGLLAALEIDFPEAAQSRVQTSILKAVEKVVP